MNWWIDPALPLQLLEGCIMEDSSPRESLMQRLRKLSLHVKPNLVQRIARVLRRGRRLRRVYLSDMVIQKMPHDMPNAADCIAEEEYWTAAVCTYAFPQTNLYAQLLASTVAADVLNLKLCTVTENFSTEDTLAPLLLALPNLQHLHIENNLDQEYADDLDKSLPCLSKLINIVCSDLKHIRTLTLNYVYALTDQHIRNIVSSLPKLTTLEVLGSAMSLSTHCLQHLAGDRVWELIDLTGSSIQLRDVIYTMDYHVLVFKRLCIWHQGKSMQFGHGRVPMKISHMLDLVWC
ncbi:hypothetical protein EON64_07375 [archaeon]|nr:MAG: hypothetical protein EON64_07375 [archaeon]